MGLMGLCGRNCSVYSGDSNMVAPNPDPLNFRILKIYKTKNAIVAKIRYPDATNFEGIKICVFEGVTATQLRAMEEIDPHFSTEAYSPIARFRPTKRGLRVARRLARSL